MSRPNRNRSRAQPEVALDYAFDREALVKFEAGLQAFLQELHFRNNLAELQLKARKICDSVTHSRESTANGIAERNKILWPSWEQDWKGTQDVYIGLYMGRIGHLDDEQGAYLYTALRHLIRFVLDGTSDYIRQRLANDLEGALGDYLSLRRYQVPPFNVTWPPSKAASKPKRRRKPSPGVQEKRDEKKRQHAIDREIFKEWRGKVWEDYQDYIDWKNEHLPRGWPAARIASTLKRRLEGRGLG